VDLVDVEDLLLAQFAEPVDPQLANVGFLDADELAQQRASLGFDVQIDAVLLVHQHSETFKQDTVLDIVFVDAFVDAGVGEDLVQKFSDFDND